MSNEVDREESERKRVKGKWHERESEREIGFEEREKNNKNKMQMNSNHINIHGYYNNFGYLDNFGLTDVEDFWGKICKICCFLYFAKFYKGWCELLLVVETKAPTLQLSFKHIS